MDGVGKNLLRSISLYIVWTYFAEPVVLDALISMKKSYNEQEEKNASWNRETYQHTSISTPPPSDWKRI